MLPGFHFGEDAVLLAGDATGLEEFEVALEQAGLGVRGAHRVGEQNHAFRLDQCEDRVELEDDNVIWQLSEGTRNEILEKLAALGSGPHPGHHFVDISGPATTLVLSRDEHLDILAGHPKPQP